MSDDAPQPIVKDGQEFLPVTEGSATILFPGTNEVFYNPVQQFNRDMSVAAIKAWVALRNQERATEGAAKMSRKRKQRGEDAEEDDAGEQADPEPASEPAAGPASADGTPGDKAQRSTKQYTVLEALSATGLRAIRYAKEIDGLGTIIANDIEEQAVKNIQRNVLHNDVSITKVVPNKADAALFMYNRRATEKFDIIDLDPYGSASPFLDAALQAVANGGLLCVTCTDLAVLAGGGQSAACWAKYGAVNVPNAPYTHEMALRILLHAIQSAASRNRRSIVPLLSCSIDFYVRVFIRVFNNAEKIKEAASKSSMVYSCSTCRTFHLQPIGKTTERPGGGPHYGVATGPPVGPDCAFCRNRHHIGGPIYSHPLHDREFVGRMLGLLRGPDRAKFGTAERMLGMLTVISEELDNPLSWALSGLAQTLHCQVVSLVSFCSAVLNAGYKVSMTHTAANCVKTDAPPSVIWDIMRCWVKKNPVAAKRLEGDTVAARILSVEPSIEANFSQHPLADPPSRKIKLVRFQENPPAWGPKARANKGDRQAKKPKAED